LKLLLDSAYLLPALGISVKEVSKDALIRLMQKGYQIFVSEISVFELSAKGAKYVTSGAISAERVARGIRAIVYSETITMIPICEDAVPYAAFKLRALLNDFIDCLILSTAMNHCDTLVTEDEDIQNLKRSKEFSELAAKINPRFQIQTLKEIR
jgi:predicted nucleic acid-binding protein